MIFPDIFYFTCKQNLNFEKIVVNLELTKLANMNTNQSKKSMLQKAIDNYNSWCREFKVGSMCVKHEFKRYSDPSEFDTQKFKKLIKTKTW